MKSYLAKAKDKFSFLKIVKKTEREKICHESDGESDFEEVPDKEGYEPNIPEDLYDEYGIKKPKIPKQSQKSWSVLQENCEEDPTSYQAALKSIEEQMKKKTYIPSTSTADLTSECHERKNKLKDKAPIVPFGNDLLNWGSKPETPLLPNYEYESFLKKKDWESEDKIDKVKYLNNWYFLTLICPYRTH